jgi:hypothetical protein
LWLRQQPDRFNRSGRDPTWSSSKGLHQQLDCAGTSRFIRILVFHRRQQLAQPEKLCSRLRQVDIINNRRNQYVSEPATFMSKSVRDPRKVKRREGTDSKSYDTWCLKFVTRDNRSIRSRRKAVILKSEEKKEKKCILAQFGDASDNSKKNPSSNQLVYAQYFGHKDFASALWAIYRITRRKWTTRRKIFWLLRLQDHRLCSPRSGARHRALAQTISNARGLDINSPRNAKNYPQDLRFHQYQQHDDPNNARGLDNNFVSDRGCDSTIITRLPLHHRLRPRRWWRTR